MTTRTPAAYRCRLDGAPPPRHDAPLANPPAPAAAADRDRYSWRLPRRRGAYLTGTAIRSDAAWQQYEDNREAWLASLNPTDLQGWSTDSKVEGTRG